jgi:hypothetical protein
LQRGVVPDVRANTLRDLLNRGSVVPISPQVPASKEMVGGTKTGEWGWQVQQRWGSHAESVLCPFEVFSSSPRTL